MLNEQSMCNCLRQNNESRSVSLPDPEKCLFVLPFVHVRQTLAPPKITLSLWAVPSASPGRGWQLLQTVAEKSF